MKNVLVLDLSQGNDQMEISFRDEKVLIQRIGCSGSPELVRAQIAAHDGKVDAIGLDGYPFHLKLGRHTADHTEGASLRQAARTTPVVDGSGLRAGLERWGVTLADRMQPGIFAQKRILMVPGVNHEGLASALSRRGSEIRYADPVVYFALPDFPGAGRPQTLDRAAALTLEQLKDAPFRRIKPQPGVPGSPRSPKPFQWADVLAGDIGAIRRYAPENLKHKIVVTDAATEEDLEDLRQRGVAVAITLLRPLESSLPLRGSSAAMVEAILVALRPDPTTPLNENTYLDLIAGVEWKPDIRVLQPEEAGINRFAFVIHPLSISFIHKHKLFRWTRFLPDWLVENFAAYIPPMYISKVTGAVSPTTGQRVEGYLYSLGATPRMMMQHSERTTYEQLKQAARLAERRGARIMGLGAFTSVIGDAGITVAHEADIAITSGNSLTVAATLEAAKQAVIKMGSADLAHGKAMVVGATGSIGSVCARLLAQAIGDVVLISIEPEKLIDLKRIIEKETPGARVTIGMQTNDTIGDCDLIVTATSAFGQRVVDISQCKPGAVICDVARPPDIGKAEASTRPDVLVVESGEVLIPGDIDFGYDIGLPPKTSYACLAETCLLAMEGRFEDYTLGRNITIERVKEIYRLFKKHQFQLAGLRSHGEYVQEEDLAVKRILADRYRRDPQYFAQVRSEASAKLALIPAASKGVQNAADSAQKWALLGLGLTAAALIFSRTQRKKSNQPKKNA